VKHLAIMFAFALVTATGNAADEVARPAQLEPAYAQESPPSGEAKTGCVDDVDNDIGAKLDNAKMTAKIKANLLADTQATGCDIDVATDGVGPLKGKL
jgi:hypothetical protein